MMIQLDQNHGATTGAAAGATGAAKGSRTWTRAYHAEEDTIPEEEEAYEAYTTADGGTDDHGEDFDADVLAADVEEMQSAFEVLMIDEMEAYEIEAFAAEAQRTGKRVSHYEQKRQMVRDGKVNRGFVQDKTHVDLGGRISFNSNQ